MNIILLLAGDYHPPAMAFPANAVIAVDGGIRHAARLGKTPDLWLGDFDSADTILQQQYACIPRLAFPADKTQTDFELALAHMNTRYGDATVHIIGSSGDEADHGFANLWVLPQSRHPCVLWQEKAVIVAAHGAASVQFCAEKESKISLFALSPLGGIDSSGLRWPLADAALPPFVALAARNETTAERAQVSWQSGMGMLFLPHHVRELRVEKR